MSNIELHERTTGINEQQQEMTFTQHQREIANLLRNIWHVADRITTADFYVEPSDHSQMITPAAFWQYVSFAGEDHAERTEELEFAITALQAILAAKPNFSN
jgi:hypothetical protein